MQAAKTLRGLTKFEDGEDPVQRWRKGPAVVMRQWFVFEALRCWRWQRQLNKASSFPAVCRKQLSAAAAATRSPWSSISSILIGLRHTAMRRHTHTHTDRNRRRHKCSCKEIEIWGHTHTEHLLPVFGYTPAYLLCNTHTHRWALINIVWISSISPLVTISAYYICIELAFSLKCCSYPKSVDTHRWDC